MRNGTTEILRIKHHIINQNVPYELISNNYKQSIDFDSIHKKEHKYDISF